MSRKIELGIVASLFMICCIQLGSNIFATRINAAAQDSNDRYQPIHNERSYLYFISSYTGTCVLSSTTIGNVKFTGEAGKMVEWTDLFGTFHRHAQGTCEVHVSQQRLPVKNAVINLDTGFGFQGKPPVGSTLPPTEKQ